LVGLREKDVVCRPAVEPVRELEVVVVVEELQVVLGCDRTGPVQVLR
jgi:hypothetical protein